MSEIGEAFESHRKQGQQKRSSNRESSADLLRQQKVKFTSHNMGAHLIVTQGEVTADFWPGTGKFIVRGTYQQGRGVFNLLKALGIRKSNAP